MDMESRSIPCSANRRVISASLPGQALIVLRVSDYHKGCEVLEKDGLHIYTQEEITKFY